MAAGEPISSLSLVNVVNVVNAVVDESSDQGSRSTSDIVFFGIVNALELHRLVPGQRLVEGDLASQFGVGRNSVREALHRLAAEGIVELFRHKGAAVRSLTLKETLDVMDVAERMTGLLARTAALGTAHPVQPHPLTEALKEIVSADRQDDAEWFARGRRHFYRALLLLSGNGELKRLFPSIQMPIVHAQHRLAGLQKLRLRDYRIIGKAVIGRDADAADAAGMAHVRNVRELILQKAARDASM